MITARGARTDRAQRASHARVTMLKCGNIRYRPTRGARYQSHAHAVRKAWHEL
jgi:hypothetical protein